MSHTPGPWARCNTAIYEMIGGTNVAIASGQNFAQQFENAQLIAAAPDMLVALRECVAWFEDNCVDCYALDDAREALKKAEGE